MKLNINGFTFFLIILGFPLNSYSEDSARTSIVKTAVRENGFMFASDLHINEASHIAPEGKTFFESPHLSLNGEIACSTCHRKDTGSSDGIPNAAGVRGYGEGVERLASGAKIVPRNSLALWGVGSKGFNTLFWDGKLVFSEEKTISQFGSIAPSKDPLITAVHLPAVEIRETLEEDTFILENKKESVEGVNVIYTAIVDNLKENESEALNNLAVKLNKTAVEVNFLDISTSIAAFIREEFKIKETRLEKFMKDEISLTKSELRGAEVFYGEGGCSLCHSGSNFTDQKFHTVPFPQLGFGKNGFGVDYGRYNATFNPADLYKFRTPSLYNVEKTSPYGHSGSVRTLREAVIAHYDPLRLVKLSSFDSLQRHEFAKVLARSDMVGMVNYLTDDEVSDLVSFLKTLSF